jgi:hypothetical protein
MYRKNAQKSERIYWKCKENSCRANAITSDSELVSQSGEHNHEACEMDIQCQKLRENAKKDVRENIFAPVRQAS